MEDRYQHTLNGQSVLQADLNVLGETSSLADDRVFAELFRVQPFDGSTVRKGILPNGDARIGSTPLIGSNGATGSVFVTPFRAFVGSRTAAGTDGKKNWRDVRSALAVAATDIAQVVSFGANSSGNPRWDLLYAAVTVDANTASVTRKKKDPTSKVITGASVVTRLATTVALGVLAGTASASPVWPAVPADAGGVYYVPLGYVYIPDGFGASSTVGTTSIFPQAPILQLAGSTGAFVCEPADQQHALTTTQQHTAAISRPRKWMPPEMTGGHSLLIAMDFTDASSANWSHGATGGVVDSRDWTNRITRWTAVVTPDKEFVWDATDIVSFGAFGMTFPGPAAPERFEGSGYLQSGIGSTMALTAGRGCAAFLYAQVVAGDGLTWLAPGSQIFLYADESDGGKLKVHVDGSPGVRVFMWIDFSGPYANARP